MLLFLSVALAECPPSPRLEDADTSVVALSQNMKLIATGRQRDERVGLLAGWLGGEGHAVDLLLLSEARFTDTLEAALPDWCLYTQATTGDGYRWRPVAENRPPGGLALGVRARGGPVHRELGVSAGRRFRAHPTSLAEGVLGRVAGYVKGWARIEVEGATIVWSHTQASYRRNPSRGAGGPGRGRAGEFDDLAADLGRPEMPTMVTGDLNLLDRFPAPEARVAAARTVDSATVARFEARTGILFHWFRPGLSEPCGSFFGCLFPAGQDKWDRGASYDQVGANAAFMKRHPGVRVRRVAIASAELRVSDHDGIEIEIPGT